MDGLKFIAAYIKETLGAAISELRADIHSLTGRVQEVENITAHQESAIRELYCKSDTHTLQLRDMQRHLEDLDNRGRRHNLQIRGLPETVEGDQLSPTVISLFNSLLDRPS